MINLTSRSLQKYLPLKYSIDELRSDKIRVPPSTKKIIRIKETIYDPSLISLPVKIVKNDKFSKKLAKLIHNQAHHQKRELTLAQEEQL